MFKSLGWPEIAIILVIVLIIFGVGKLPQIGNAIGKSMREFRKAQSEDDPEKAKKGDKDIVQSTSTEQKEKS
jgi:sec-independent protein translocase protein TatA